MVHVFELTAMQEPRVSGEPGFVLHMFCMRRPNQTVLKHQPKVCYACEYDLLSVLATSLLMHHFSELSSSPICAQMLSELRPSRDLIDAAPHTNNHTERPHPTRQRLPRRVTNVGMGVGFPSELCRKVTPRGQDVQNSLADEQH